ncbi:MAG: hypothetical protein R2939_22935 [Kofleriaceae bacterium]
MRSLGVLLLVWWIGLAGARADDAAPQTAEAQARFDAGTAAYQAADYDRAATEFAAGYAAEPWAGFLYARAQAERKRGRCDVATGLYQRFLAADPPPRARQLAEDALAACGDSSPPPITTPPPASTPPPVTSPPPEAVDLGPAPGFHHKLAVGLLAAGAISGGLATWSYLSARAAAADAERAPTFAEFEPLAERSEDRLLLARVAGGVGAALVVAGVVRLVVHGPPRRAARRVEVGLGPSGQLVVAGAF